MNKTFKMVDLFFGKKKAAQEKKEKRFFAQYGNKTIKLARLYRPANDPTEFIQALNSYMLAVDGFKPFKLKDVRVFNVFTADGNEFIDSVFAIPRSYGLFYVSVGCQDVFLFRDSEAKFVPAKHFRLYLNKGKKSEKFAKCIWRRQKVLVTGIFEEWQGASGDHYSEELQVEFKLPCPLETVLKIETA